MALVGGLSRALSEVASLHHDPFGEASAEMLLGTRRALCPQT